MGTSIKPYSLKCVSGPLPEGHWTCEEKWNGMRGCIRVRIKDDIVVVDIRGRRSELNSPPIEALRRDIEDDFNKNRTSLLKLQSAIGTEIIFDAELVRLDERGRVIPPVGKVESDYQYIAMVFDIIDQLSPNPKTHRDRRKALVQFFEGFSSKKLRLVDSWALGVGLIIAEDVLGAFLQIKPTAEGVVFKESSVLYPKNGERCQFIRRCKVLQTIDAVLTNIDELASNANQIVGYFRRDDPAGVIKAKIPRDQVRFDEGGAFEANQYFEFSYVDKVGNSYQELHFQRARPDK